MLLLDSPMLLSEPSWVIVDPMKMVDGEKQRALLGY